MPAIVAALVMSVTGSCSPRLADTSSHGGSSNQPALGLTLSALLISALLMVTIGVTGLAGVAAVLGVAAVVCVRVRSPAR